MSSEPAQLTLLFYQRKVHLHHPTSRMLAMVKAVFDKNIAHPRRAEVIRHAGANRSAPYIVFSANLAVSCHRWCLPAAFRIYRELREADLLRFVHTANSPRALKLAAFQLSRALRTFTFPPVRSRMSATSVGLPGLPASGPPPSLDNTYGATLLGTFFGLMCAPFCPLFVCLSTHIPFQPIWLGHPSSLQI